MTDLERAAALLAQGDDTCVLCRGDARYHSSLRGVQYLMQLIEAGVELTGFSAADKVVGKATAMLFVKCGVAAVHAGVISKAAEEMLARYGILYTFDTRTERIVNRAGTGMCPMEQAVWELEDPALAPGAIRAAMARLRTANGSSSTERAGG